MNKRLERFRRGLGRRLPVAARVWRWVRGVPDPRATGPTPDSRPEEGCVTCRSLDSPTTQSRAAADLLNALSELGLPTWRLPSRAGIRIGTAYVSEETLHQLEEQMAQLGWRTDQRTFQPSYNNYEFDLDHIVPPESACYLRFQPDPHCGSGAPYLKRRWVTLEPLSVNDDHVVVPRYGHGPRVYARDRIDALSVTAEDTQYAGRPWPFPIDLVFTWVDSSDPAWRDDFERHAGTRPSLPKSATNASRWHSRDELLYSLRSAHMYANFARNIFVVTNGQVPSWLAEDEKVHTVTHAEIFADPADLPTFSARPIESSLHRIDGLSEHFLYLNDDFFFGRPVAPSLFFSEGGVGKAFFSNRYLPDMPVADHDRASVVSHKNTREAFIAKFGVKPEKKFQHAPYVMRRSVWQSIEEDFAEELARTRSNRFRSWDDINPVPFLYNHYAMMNGFATAGEVKYHYVDVNHPKLLSSLKQLHTQAFDVFCINDADSHHEDVSANDEVLRRFFETRFPLPAPWESGDA